MREIHSGFETYEETIAFRNRVSVALKKSIVCMQVKCSKCKNLIYFQEEAAAKPEAEQQPVQHEEPTPQPEAVQEPAKAQEPEPAQEPTVQQEPETTEAEMQQDSHASQQSEPATTEDDFTKDTVANIDFAKEPAAPGTEDMEAEDEQQGEFQVMDSIGGDSEAPEADQG